MIPHEPCGIEDREIDLLVDGELNDTSRVELLARLEASPDGWRRCALAFLEAQAWQGAFTVQAASIKSAIRVSDASPRVPLAACLPVSWLGVEDTGRQAASGTRSRLIPWLARAAVMLLAFGLGWAVHGAGKASAPPRVVVMPTPLARPIPSPTRPAPILTGLGRDRPAPVDYVRGHLEREGYRFEQRLLLVPAATRDGRRVAVPVEQVKLRFVGNRSV
ncbi:MAG: hypothetical protein JWN86_4308 [Planctomycetota bacterium]|nr:hypothetical protein [Planctomycetota bacterium]